MAVVVPTGSPAWTRTADFSSYGGHASKENYLGRGPIDALTDVGAEEFSRAAADLAAVARTAPFAVITYLNNDTAPAAPTIEYAYMMTGIRTTSYAGASAPTGFPSASRSSDGVVVFTFASSYTDEYGIPGAFVPRHVIPGLMGTTPGMVTWEIIGSTVTLRVFNDAGVALTNRRVTFKVS